MSGREDEGIAGVSTPPTSLDAERWRAVKAVLQEALDRPPAERAAFVEHACRDDLALRREVDALLVAAEGVTPAPVISADRAADARWLAAGGPEQAATTLARLQAALADRYVVERELGRGGMAVVYLARDLRHRRPVALKVLGADLGAVLGPSRFRREVETAAGLSHPHVLPLFDSGDAGGLLYYVMPYVEGESLRERLRREGRLSRAEALRVVREVADALDYAHRHGVVHRDVKPENVLLDETGHALIADFGIARAMHHATSEGADGTGAEPAATLTRRGAVVGTPAYMSPEQALGEREVDGRSDVYSLGCVAFELLAGEAPFRGPGAEQIARRLTQAPPRISAPTRSGPIRRSAAGATRSLTLDVLLPSIRAPSKRHGGSAGRCCCCDVTQRHATHSSGRWRSIPRT